jgi:hypothetical protein
MKNTRKSSTMAAQQQIYARHVTVVMDWEQCCPVRRLTVFSSAKAMERFAQMIRKR